MLEGTLPSVDEDLLLRHLPAARRTNLDVQDVGVDRLNDHLKWADVRTQSCVAEGPKFFQHTVQGTIAWEGSLNVSQRLTLP